MDGSSVEHSDSDSGESWILLEQDQSPNCADDAPSFLHQRDSDVADSNDKDEDTDGISIISDSEPESFTPCDISSEEKNNMEESRPNVPLPSNVMPVIPNRSSDKAFNSIENEDVFLGDNHKLKTYVHRRNKRLSTVLNIIVLGSVITAAGVAIGHMWGVRDDCSMHSTPSVNKILSNLYKLQEENAYLRSIIKELTLNVNNKQAPLKSEEQFYNKQHRCKKVFEEPLTNKNVQKLTKCVDNQSDNFEILLENHLKTPKYEKEFMQDISKLKNVYKENQSWLDEEVIRRLENEKSLQEVMNNHKLSKLEQENYGRENNNIDLKQNVDTAALHNKLPTLPNKVTYADSLKFNNQENLQVQKSKIVNNDNFKKSKVHNIRKNRAKREYHSALENSISEDDFVKDDRHTMMKQKFERKKQDRQKINKKQKRKNKYEQWEMKGGYLKDYDDFSLESSQGNDDSDKNTLNNVIKNSDKNTLNKEFVLNHIDQCSDSDTTRLPIVKPETASLKCGKNDKGCKETQTNWYEHRALMRADARKKLEQEMFGENSPNAGWYFRRMQRREQCRAKGDNTTHRKLLKRNKNYKTKH